MPSNKTSSAIPSIMYGTAWKEEATEELVRAAITLGFRGIDTANQRRHYHESAVGDALGKVIKEGIRREDLFIQTKFTYAGGQDERIPYDARADYGTQVRQSFQSSLEHLRTDYIDSYILHGPLLRSGLTPTDWIVWEEMESLVAERRALRIGVSNVNMEQLQSLWKGATVKPAFVQNRCFAQQGWDQEIREYCRQNKIVYQGFSLLTANPFVLSKIKHIAEKMKKTPAQVIFRFSVQAGMLPLTGTSSKRHMKEDLELGFVLSPDDMEFIENIGMD